LITDWATFRVAAVPGIVTGGARAAEGLVLTRELLGLLCFVEVVDGFVEPRRWAATPVLEQAASAIDAANTVTTIPDHPRCIQRRVNLTGRHPSD
jgi:hypothetical protein